MTYQILAKSLEELLNKHGLSDWEFDATLRFKKDGEKSDNFKLTLVDGKSGEKVLKLRVRDGEIDSATYFGADDVERCDKYEHGEVVEVEQRQNDKRAGSRLRKRRGQYQHRHADEKGGWVDIEAETLHSDQIELLVGPVIGEQSVETTLFREFLASKDAFAGLIGRRLDIERDVGSITVFGRKTDKHTFTAVELLSDAAENQS